MSSQSRLTDHEPEADLEPVAGQRRLGLSAWRFAPDFEPGREVDDAE